MASLLIEFKANVNAKGDNETPLRAAALGGHLAMVKLLLDHGANVNDKGDWDQTALQAATHEKHVKVAQLLLERGADPDIFNSLSIAIKRDHEELLEVLLQGCANPNNPQEWGFLAIELAALKGNLNMVKMLLEHGADVNALGHFGRTPLGASIEGGSKEVFDAIWAAGAKPSIDAMGHAIRQDRADALGMLIDKGVDPKSFDMLRLAVWSRRPKMVETLIKAGADPNKPGDGGVTPLKAAALREDLDIVKILIAHGVNLKDPGVQEVISIVIQRKRDDILIALLRAGADINSTGVLQTAISEGRDELVQRLVAAGADVNGRDQQGRTPLVAALKSGKMNIAEELLRKGAKP